MRNERDTQEKIATQAGSALADRARGIENGPTARQEQLDFQQRLRNR